MIHHTPRLSQLDGGAGRCSSLYFIGERRLARSQGLKREGASVVLRLSLHSRTCNPHTGMLFFLLQHPAPGIPLSGNDTRSWFIKEGRRPSGQRPKEVTTGMC